MAKRRLIAGSGLRPVQRGTAVRVRDDFNAGAARGASSDLEQIASGLGQLAPKLQGLALSLNEKKRQEGQAIGRTRLVELAQEQESMGEAVRLGLLEFKDNPFARAGLLEQAGRISGDRYGDELRLAVAQIEDKSDIATYDRVAAEVFAKHQDAAGPSGKNKFFRNGFATSSQAATTNQRVQYAANQSAELVGVAGDQLFEEAFGKIETSLIDGIAAADIGAELTAMGNEAILNGMNKTLVNNTIVEAVAQKAIELAHRSPEQAAPLLDILDNVIGGSGPLSRTRTGTATINAALDKIETVVQRGYKFDDFQARAAKDELIASTTAAAFEELVASGDPTAVDLAPYIAKLVDGGAGNAANGLRSIQNALAAGEFGTEEAVFRQLSTRIWTNGDVTETEVANATGLGKLSTPDGQNLVRQIESQRRNARAGQGATDPIFANTLTDVSRSFQDSLGVLGGLRGEQASRAEASIQWDYYSARDAGVFDEMADADRAAWLRERASHWIEYYGGGKPIGQELKGRAIQAFIGRKDAWQQNVVVTGFQYSELVLRAVAKELTSADLALLSRLGVPPDAVLEFLQAQRKLIIETVTISNTQREEEAADGGLADSLTEG